MIKNMSMIKIVNLQKESANGTSLKDINLEINKGEVVSIIGPAKSGKSTLLKCINLIEKPTAGKIYFENEEITSPECGVDFIRKNIGIVPRTYNLFPNINIIENVIVATVNLLKQPKPEAYEYGMECLKTVGLENLAHNFPADLSDGQKQRAAIARALAMKPKVLLFDDSTISLDPIMVREVFDIIKKLADQGQTMVIVSDELTYVRDISTKVVFIENGAICEIGRPDQLFERPQNEKTKTFFSRSKRLNLEIVNSGYDFAGFTSALDRFARALGLPDNIVRNVQLIFEEVVSQNLVPYSEAYYNIYPIMVTASYSDSEECLNLRITCSGMQFNPLEECEDISGLIIQKLSTEAKYSYVQGVNCIDIVLK